MRRSVKGFITGVLSFGMIFSSFGAAWAATPADIKGHWAEERLQEWFDKGYIKGYPNGTLQPDRTVTRAEFVAMINRVLGYTDITSVNFKDMSSAKWAADDIAKAVKAGYIQGYGNQTFRPNAKITREETAMIIARIMKLNPQSTPLNFKDANQIATWSKGSVAAVVDQKLMGGYPNGTFGPKRPLKRAESVAVIHRISITKAPEMGAVYDKPGTYGSTTDTEYVRGGVTVSTSGVTLQNMEIEGDLILGAGIGEGDVTLNNVKVKGKTFVNGGGATSVKLNSSVLDDVTVDKEKGSVRIIASGSTQVQHTKLKSPAILQETSLTGTGFVNVTLEQDMKPGQVELSGAFNMVNVFAPNAQLALTSGTIQDLTVNSSATNANIRLDQGTTVVKMTLHTAATITGKGTIQKVILSDAAKTTRFETPPLASENAPTVPVTPPSGGSGGSGGGGGGGGGGNDGGTTPTPPTDNTVPKVTYGVYINPDSVTSSTAAVYVEADELATVHYVVYTDKDPVPTKEEILTGKDSNGNVIEAKKTKDLIANERTRIELDKLDPDTTYKVYIVVTDRSNNSTAREVIEFKTKPTTQ